MNRPSKTRNVTDKYELKYTHLERIIKESGGWISSGGPDGDSVSVWNTTDDTEYNISGEALTRFYQHAKDILQERVFIALDLIDYIKKSKHQPPSVFLRDAIVTKALEAEEKIK